MVNKPAARVQEVAENLSDQVFVLPGGGSDPDSEPGRFVWSSANGNVYINAAAAQMLSLPENVDSIPIDQIRDRLDLTDVLAGRTVFGSTQVGDSIDFQLHTVPPARSAQLRIRGIVSPGDHGGITVTGTVESVAVEASERPTRSNLAGALRALTRANTILATVVDEHQLLTDVADMIVDGGDYLFAWYGKANRDQSHSVTPIAWSGADASYLDELEFSWGDGPAGQGPTGQAIRSGQTRYAHFIKDNPAFGPWREAALARGFAASIALPIIVDGTVEGALMVYAAHPMAFDDTEVMILNNLGISVSVGISRLRDKRIAERALEGVIGVLEESLTAHEPYTPGHEKRVSGLAVAIARHLRLPEHDIEAIRLGAILHDMGKVGIPAELLNAPRRLTSEEMVTIRRHPVIGAEIVGRFDFPYPVAEMVRHHHERLDGSGYPDGLTGDEIPLGVRVISVADVVDSMSEARPYRQALGLDAALAEVVSNAGTLYDQAVVDACVAVLTGLPTEY